VALAFLCGIEFNLMYRMARNKWTVFIVLGVPASGVGPIALEDY
jgi:hypothetical protein